MRKSISLLAESRHVVLLAELFMSGIKNGRGAANC